LAQLLQQVQPQTLILAASAHSWDRLPQQLAQLRELGQAKPWDPAALAAATGLPQQWLEALEGSEQISTGLLSRIRESQAFHRWLDEASPAQIAQLCQRLLQPDPVPLAFSPA
jgi:single-stranded-DNA-specific exonuclease